MSEATYNLLITSYIEPELVEQIRAVSPRLRVIYEPDMLPKPRYASDHTNTMQRTPEQQQRWDVLVGQADILFDFDYTHIDTLPERAARARWVQASSAGIGQLVRRRGLAERMPSTVFTTASGIHAQPLAEFCLLAMLMSSRDLRTIQQGQADHRWQRFGATDLEGRTLGIIGVGNIGKEVARMARAVGMRVIGNKRTTQGVDPASLHLDALYSAKQLPELLRQSEYLILIAPHTDETEKFIGEEELALLPRGAYLINIGRGQTVDEPAMIAALQRGQLSGAALDVTAVEPLPADSPLWDMPNVLISPHSAATTDRENARLVRLFCENLRRFLAGQTLENVLDIELLY